MPNSRTMVMACPPLEARANAYVKNFKNLTIDGQPLKLDYLFAVADSRSSHHPRLTIEPTAKELGLTIDTRFKNQQFQDWPMKFKAGRTAPTF
jgi:hypothetical protein